MTIAIITAAIIAAIVAFSSGCVVGSRFMLSRLEEVVRERKQYQLTLFRMGKMDPDDIFRRERQYP